jgi:hypothetical protein
MGKSSQNVTYQHKQHAEPRHAILQQPARGPKSEPLMVSTEQSSSAAWAGLGRER